jgi:hypothetical protein
MAATRSTPIDFNDSWRRPTTLQRSWFAEEPRKDWCCTLSSSRRRLWFALHGLGGRVSTGASQGDTSNGVVVLVGRFKRGPSQPPRRVEPMQVPTISAWLLRGQCWRCGPACRCLFTRERGLARRSRQQWLGNARAREGWWLASRPHMSAHEWGWRWVARVLKGKWARIVVADLLRLD